MMRRLSRSAAMALAISAPVALFVAAGQVIGSEFAHTTAFVAVILGLPWVVPAFVVIAVLSAPIYVALHFAGHPLDLMPWLSGVILIGSIVATHINAHLLSRRLLRRPARAQDDGLAGFLFRARA
jgi:hypothetical protein